MRGIILSIASLFAVTFILGSQAPAAQPQIGDCIALMFTKSNSKNDASVQNLYQQAISNGWAVRLVDGNEEASFAKRWRIENYPTIVLVRNSREFDRLFAAPAFDELSRRMLAASNPESVRVGHLARQAAPSQMLVRGQSPAAVSSAAAVNMNPVSRPGAITPGSAIAGAGNSLSALPSNPAEATVRIRVEEPNSEVFGTGTIIDTYQGEALILTCGHLFRDAKSSARISVETFIGGVAKAYPAVLIDFQAAETDIGLISFRPEGPVAVAKLIDHRVHLQEGESVYSWGCDNGNTPTRRDSRISKLNRYVGPPNVEVYGAPVQGRSGGGLFNSRGELIGVCYAADNQLNEGLYNAPQVVYNQLNRLGLRRLYDVGTANSAAVASNNPHSQRSDQTRASDASFSTNAALFQPATSMTGNAPISNPAPRYDSQQASAPMMVSVADEHGRIQQIQVTPEMMQAIRNQGAGSSNDRYR